MSWAAVSRAIEMRLAANPVSYGGSTLPLITSDNVPAPTAQYWVRATVRHGSEADAALGGAHIRGVGLVLFQIFGPVGVGLRPYATVSDALFAVLDLWSDDTSGVRFPADGNPRRIEGASLRVADDLYMCSFSMPFSVDRFV